MESVKQQICYLGRIDFHYIVNLRSINFIKKLNINESNNTVMNAIASRVVNYKECVSILSFTSVKLHWGCAHIRAHVFNDFNNKYKHKIL